MIRLLATGRSRCAAPGEQMQDAIAKEALLEIAKTRGSEQNRLVPVDKLGLCGNPTPTTGVHRGSNCGSTTMWRSIRSEVREIAWLASIVGGLSVVSVGIALALVAG